MITQLFGRLFGTERWQRIQREKQEREEAFRQAVQDKKDRESRERILRYPEKEMKKEEFEKLPRLNGLDWDTCPLDTWFVCAPTDLLPGVVILGHKACRDELILEQMGARTSDFESCFNRYRLKLT